MKITCEYVYSICLILLQVVPVLLKHITKMSSIRLYLPKDLRSSDNRFSVGKSIQEVIRRFPDGVPLLDPIEDMNIKDEQFKKVIRVRKFCI